MFQSKRCASKLNPCSVHSLSQTRAPVINTGEQDILHPVGAHCVQTHQLSQSGLHPRRVRTALHARMCSTPASTEQAVLPYLLADNTTVIAAHVLITLTGMSECCNDHHTLNRKTIHPMHPICTQSTTATPLAGCIQS